MLRENTIIAGTHAYMQRATHSWGIPCLGKGGLLNLGRRSGDGSG
jgi:hypothetical protein